jgi:hypothetical protein
VSDGKVTEEPLVDPGADNDSDQKPPPQPTSPEPAKTPD